MSPSIIRTLISCCLVCSFIAGQMAGAAERAESSDNGKIFASVWRIRGDVFAAGESGVPRKLQMGETVYVGERIRATSSGEAVLKTADAGVVAIRPGAEFVPERFSAEGKATDRQLLRLLTGSLRVISGWITRFNRNDHQVATPFAVIGIRGTDHEPYVLPAEKANEIYRQGTYDKVNRGATSLEANGGNVIIEPGRVGFARDPESVGAKKRALMTILLPTLLSKVPDFYVPGAFDSELDHYSENAEQLGGKVPESRATGVQSSSAQQIPVAIESELPGVAPVGCAPQAVGEYWLKRFDHAIASRDAQSILSLFAENIVAQASVRSADGHMKTLEFNREDMVQSTLASIASLKNYQQRRISIEAHPADGKLGTSCPSIKVKSVVIEQGLMNDKPYRFEATETYLLEQRNGEWLATHAETVQR